MDKNNILAIWLFKKDLPLKRITKEENLFTKGMTDEAAYQFIHSRGYARYALSKIFYKNPLEIPLNAKPHTAPELPLNYGYISLSHCKDMLAVGWSLKRIGIDIERADRQISSVGYFKKLFSNDLKSRDLKNYNNKEFRSIILDFWVLKESLVKWEKSSIFGGFNNWKLSQNLNYAFNIKSDLKVQIQKINLYEWKIGLACNHSRNSYPIQICI